jgi:hypothetical protein
MARLDKDAGRLILWMEDDANVPDAERIYEAYERITDDGVRFRYDSKGFMKGSRNTLRKILDGQDPIVKVLLEKDDGPSVTYALSNGLFVCFSGERCSMIYVLSSVPVPPPGCVRTPEGKDLKVLGTSEEGWILVGRNPDTGLCYPFAVGVCDNPKCNCREEKQAAEAAKEQQVMSSDGNRYVGGGVPTEAQLRDAHDFVDGVMGPINKKVVAAIFKKAKEEVCRKIDDDIEAAIDREIWGPPATIPPQNLPQTSPEPSKEP